MLIPTMKIKAPHHPRGWAIINIRDFDPKLHEAYDADAAAARAAHGAQERAAGELQPKSIPAPVAILSDDKLREEIERLSGRKPHHKAGREKLEVQYAELTAAKE